MEKNERAALLRCGLFAGMDGGQAEALLACLGGQRMDYEKNAVLWRAGEPVRACAVVLAGSVRAEAVRADGARTYKDVMELMALIRRSGFEDVTLVTQAEGK